MGKEELGEEVLFDRLVDGELTDEERRDLLISLDTRHDGWRRCAIAFLEAQSWKDHCTAMLCGPEATSSMLSDSGNNLQTRPARYLRRGFGVLAMAASLLVAFMLGSQQNGDEDHFAAGTPAASQQLADVPPSLPDGAPESTTSPDDAITLWVQDDHGHRRPLRVPLVDAGQLDRELGLTFQSAIPAGVREWLEQQGFNVQSRGRYAPLWLENGQPMIVPVEDTRIVPVSSPVY